VLAISRACRCAGGGVTRDAVTFGVTHAVSLVELVFARLGTRRLCAWHVAAALVALGMRASEITSRRLSDLDRDVRPGDLLWIPCSNTFAGRRSLEVAEVLAEVADARRATRTFSSATVHTSSAAGCRTSAIGSSTRCNASAMPPVKRVTAHATRGVLATISGER
jgi:hypothetical protein